METGQPSKELRKPDRLETSAAATAAAAKQNKKIGNTQHAKDESA